MFASKQKADEEKLLTIQEAAHYLGVCSETLRNWDRSEKLKAIRHPINGYRLYSRAALEHLRPDNVVHCEKKTKRQLWE